MEFHYPSIEIGIVLYPDVAFAAVQRLTDMVTLSSVKIFPALSDWSSSALAPAACLSTACHTPGA